MDLNATDVENLVAVEIGDGFTKHTLSRSTSEMMFILASHYSVTFVFK